MTAEPRRADRVRHVTPPLRQPSAQQAPVKIGESVPVPRRIAAELNVRDGQVLAAIELLDGGATLPFIARYRQEATGALDGAPLLPLTPRPSFLPGLHLHPPALLQSTT